jgi:hypothetical protein
MCKLCSPPRKRYLVRDVQTDILVCEACGLAFENLEGAGRCSPRHISELNRACPRFRSFEDLISRITQQGRITRPHCRVISEVPSRVLSQAVEMLGNLQPEVNEKKH